MSEFIHLKFHRNQVEILDVGFIFIPCNFHPNVFFVKDLNPTIFKFPGQFVLHLFSPQHYLVVDVVCRPTHQASNTASFIEFGTDVSRLARAIRVIVVHSPAS